MSRLFDGRHRWGPREDIAPMMFKRTCQVCGRVDVADNSNAVVPEAFIETMVAALGQPNPYRAMFGRMGW